MTKWLNVRVSSSVSQVPHNTIDIFQTLLPVREFGHEGLHRRRRISQTKLHGLRGYRLQPQPELDGQQLEGYLARLDLRKTKQRPVSTWRDDNLAN